MENMINARKIFKNYTVGSDFAKCWFFVLIIIVMHFAVSLFTKSKESNNEKIIEHANMVKLSKNAMMNRLNLLKNNIDKRNTKDLKKIESKFIVEHMQRIFKTKLNIESRICIHTARNILSPIGIGVIIAKPILFNVAILIIKDKYYVALFLCACVVNFIIKNKQHISTRE
jgi:hypothetical protein